MCCKSGNTPFHGRTRLALIFAVIGLGLIGCREQALKPCKPPKALTAPNVFFIVIDTVRSDHTSLCGFDKPTTPHLERLARAKGAFHTCDAIAPASWTFPSHASFFTGTDPLEHGAHSLIRGLPTAKGWGSHVRRLDDKLPTLAEKMRAAGYRSALFSANPVVSDGLGLTRGFAPRKVAGHFGELHGKRFLPAFKTFAEGLPRNKPVFLFINISDAHQPWAGVPKGIPWAAAAPSIRYQKSNEGGPWRRFVEGRMPPDELASYRDAVKNAYTYATFMADRNLGRTVDYLNQNGWCEHGCRFIVTSDHGEFLGEHGLLDHGNYVWEPMARVPFAVWGQTDIQSLPKRLNATAAFDLTLTGRLPEKPRPVTCMAWPHMRRCAHTQGKAFCSISAAVWQGQEKLMFLDESYYRIDLSKNPDEVDLTPIAQHPRLEPLKKIATRMVAQKQDDKTPDFEVIEKLRALGYMD